MSLCTNIIIQRHGQLRKHLQLPRLPTQQEDRQVLLCPRTLPQQLVPSCHTRQFLCPPRYLCTDYYILISMEWSMASSLTLSRHSCTTSPPSARSAQFFATRRKSHSLAAPSTREFLRLSLQLSSALRMPASVLQSRICVAICCPSFPYHCTDASSVATLLLL
jgi:hypothetical protein